MRMMVCVCVVYECVWWCMTYDVAVCLCSECMVSICVCE